MEPRKVQKVGAASLSLSLPKDWTRNGEIKQGDVLYCQAEADGTLRLIPASLAQELAQRKESAYLINADLCTAPGLMEKLVVGNYVLGRNLVVIQSRDRLKRTHLREIRSAVARLMGIGIMEESPKELVIQTALNLEQFTINSLLKRLHTIVTAMIGDAIAALRSLEVPLAEEVVQREKEADQLYWLVLRLILTAQSDPRQAEILGPPNTIELLGDRTVAKFLESVGDHAESIAKVVLELKVTQQEFPSLEFHDQLKALGKEAKAIIHDSMAALLAKDLELANSVINRCKQAYVADREFRAQTLSFADQPMLMGSIHAVASHLKAIVSYGTSIAAIAINRNLESASRICQPQAELELK